MSGSTTDFNLGADWSIDITDPLNGGVLSWPLLTGFSKQQNTTEVSSTPINGIRLRKQLPDGWSGTLTYDRASSAIDDYFAAVEEAFYQGRPAPFATLTETVREIGGGISQYRYEQVAFTLSQGGNAQGREKVEMSVDWTASRRRKVI